LQYCEREKSLISEGQVNAALAQLKSQLGPNATDDDLEKSMHASGIFVDPATYVRQRLLFQAYVQTKNRMSSRLLRFLPLQMKSSKPMI